MPAEEGSPAGAPAFLTDSLGIKRNTEKQVDMVFLLRPSDSNRDLPPNGMMCRNRKKNESLEEPFRVIPG